VRRRRWAGIALAASLPAVAIATGLALRQRSRAEREREIDRHLVEAARRVEAARTARAAAVRDRGEAFRWFDAYRDDRAEPAWSIAQTELASARAAYAAAVRELEVTLLIDNARGDIRARITGALFEQAELAELAGDRDATRELEARLAAFDPDGTLTAAWREPAALAIDAPGAVEIAVRGYADHGDRLELAAPIAVAKGPRLETRLPPGSYSIELRGGDGLVVRDPVLAARGEALALSVPLPRAADVPPGMIYVPPGRFLIGDGGGNEYYRKTFLLTSPLHAITTGAYLIAANEVTFGDWMVYLRALPPAEREQRRPQVSSDNGGSLRLDGGRRPDEPFTLTLQPTIQPLVAREGEPLVYPGRTRRKAIRWEAAPVGGISLEDARAYTAWLAATGRVPGARLCNEREWERAARGADGRRWAHGNRIEPDDADIDVTYGRRDDAYGPDEVGAHPASTSPFGLADTVGNMWEWAVPAIEQAIERAPGSPELALLRGGCWYQGGASAEVANRDVNPTRIRWTWSGLRICATPK
jgi:formylglycine-generating enzyme required for sulfatase activity